MVRHSRVVSGWGLGALFMAALLGAAGCGAPSEGDGGGGYSTGLPRDKQVKDLTEADLQRACRSVQSGTGYKLTDAEVRGLCAAELAKASPEACTDAAIKDCMASYRAQEEPPDPSECSNAGEDRARFADCAITVGQWEDCMNDSREAYRKATSQLSCTMTEMAEPPAPPSCVTAKERCPALFSSSSPGGEG